MDMEDIVEANQAAGKYFFNEDTMARFQTQLIEATYDHVAGDLIYFATSDADYNGDRIYKVRVFSRESSSVWTPYSNGENMVFHTEAEALAKAKELAALPV